MKKVFNQVMRMTEEMMWNIVRQQNLAAVHTHTHTHGNLIDRMRVVEDYSICSGRNRLLLDRLRDVSSEGLFCVYMESKILII